MDALRLLMHQVDQPAEHVGIRLRKDAMAEVEHMAGPPRRLAKDVEGARPRRAPAREEPRCVEVALDPATGSDPPPRIGQGHAMVEPDDVAAGVSHELE